MTACNQPLLTENQYLKLIHEGLCTREQWQYLEKLKNLSASVSQDEVRTLLDKAPDIEPLLKTKCFKK